MTFIKTTELQCDDCGTDFTLDDDTSSKVLRSVAKAHGWAQRHTKFGLMDLCHTCAAILDGEGA